MRELSSDGAVLKVWTLPTDRQPTEHEEQMDFVRWFRRTHEGVRIFAIPNGGERNKVDAIRLKSEGVSRGVPDLYIPAWKLWVEMKRRDEGSLSVDQKDWIIYLESIGDTVLVCHGSIKAQAAIERYISHSSKPCT